MLQRINVRLLCLVGVVVALVLLIKHHHAHSIDAPSRIVVETAHVNVGNISIQAHAVGTLIANKSVQITPEIAGQVSAILFKDGAPVKQGAPLVRLNDQGYRAKVISAQAALFYAKTNYHRMQILGKQGAVAQQAIDAALAELKQKQADSAEAEIALQKIQLNAPFDGVLSKSLVSPGNYVTVGQAIVTLTDVQHLRVEYSVSERYFPLLHIGQSVSITSNTYPGKEFVGKLAYISPTINSEDRTISLYADIPNEDRLLTAGLYVVITHSLGEIKNALLIPTESLVPTIDGQKVFKIINGKAVSAPIMIGQRSETSVQIEQGLQASDVVVSAGQDKLNDGSLVVTQLKMKAAS